MKRHVALVLLFGIVCSVSVFAQKKPSTSPDEFDEFLKKQKVTATPTPPPRSAFPLTPRQIVDRVMPSVVLIVSQDEDGEPVAQGSGFVYQPGLVVTNLHVFKRASNAYVKLVSGGINYKIIEVVGIDFRHDLCIVRIDDTSIPPLRINISNKPSIGDEIFAIGNPKGLEGSVSKGIISSFRKDPDLIQMDAAISPGSSGGPLVDDRAEVIGITVSTLVGGQNLNFAIPSAYLGSLKLMFKVRVVDAAAFSLNDRTKEKLKGLVKGFTEKRAEFDYDPRTAKYSEGEPKLSDKKVFDLDGNIIQDWEYIEDRLWWINQYTYDENGFITRHIEEYPDGKKKTREYTLDESMSSKLEDKRFSGSHETEISKSIFDRDGNEIELSARLTTGVSRWSRSYDRNGFVTEEKHYQNDSLASTRHFKYETDDVGNWIRCYETVYSAKYPSLGFTPSSVIYREFVYFGQ